MEVTDPVKELEALKAEKKHPLSSEYCTYEVSYIVRKRTRSSVDNSTTITRHKMVRMCRRKALAGRQPPLCIAHLKKRLRDEIKRSRMPI